jgi:hypothetical protein
MFPDAIKTGKLGWDYQSHWNATNLDMTSG